MTVNDFLKLDKGNTLYKLIDASVPGYMVNPTAICEYSDRNIVRTGYGTKQVAGFEASGKNKIHLYVKGVTA